MRPGGRDAVFDSVSVERLSRKTRRDGVVFCSFSEAGTGTPDLIEKYLAR